MHGFKLKKEDITVEIAGIRAAGKNGEVSGSGIKKHDKAADILVLDIRNISSVFDNALWSFEQTYMPYLKGKGDAHISISEGHIRLGFELKKRRRSEESNAIWEPVLCLKDRHCAIQNLSISLGSEGATRLVWIANKLANMLKVSSLFAYGHASSIILIHLVLFTQKCPESSTGLCCKNIY